MRFEIPAYGPKHVNFAGVRLRPTLNPSHQSAPPWLELADFARLRDFGNRPRYAKRALV